MQQTFPTTGCQPHPGSDDYRRYKNTTFLYESGRENHGIKPPSEEPSQQSTPSTLALDVDHAPMVLMKPFTPSSSSSPAFAWALRLWICLTVVLIHGGIVLGQRNISVTQDSTSIVYRGEWRSVNDTRSIGGAHRLAVGAGASAEYTFTGTAFYFSSAKWPYPIRSNVSMDGRPGIILDLQDHDSPEQSRNASATAGVRINERGVWSNLSNGRHTVRITVPIGDQGAVVDGFIITLPAEGVVDTTTGTTTTGTTSATDTTTSTDTTPTPEPDPVETSTEDWATVTSTYTTVEDLGLETQTVIIVEVPATGTSDASNSDASSSSSSSSGGFNKGLAIGFGVAFGVILIILLVGIIFWIRRRDKLFQDRDQDGGTWRDAPLPPLPTRQVGGGKAPSTFTGSVRGYEHGVTGSSGVATPLPHNNMAGVGSGPLRDSGRRHSYDGTFLRPHTQPEPWTEGFSPSVGREG